MLIIDVSKERNIDSALKKLNQKFRKTKMREELNERKEFTKKSILKREQKRKAAFLEKKRRSQSDK